MRVSLSSLQSKIFNVKKDISIPRGLNTRLNQIYQAPFESRKYNPKSTRRVDYIKNSLIDLLIKMNYYTDENEREDVALSIMEASYGIDVNYRQELLGMLINLCNNRTYVSFQRQFKKIVNRCLEEQRLETLNSFVDEANPPTSHDIKHYGMIGTPNKCAEFFVKHCPINKLQSLTTKALVGCAGKGTDLDALIITMMNSLRNMYADEEERLHHILSHRIFVCEKDPYNVKFLREKWGPSLHIYEGDIMNIITDPHLRQQVFNESRFDIFLMHPPFEKNHMTQSASEQDSRKRGGSSICWKILKAVRNSDLLADDAYCAFLLPMGWREYTTGSNRAFGLYEWMTKQMMPIRIENIDKEESKNLFESKVALGGFDLYCAINRNNNGCHTAFCCKGMEYQFDLTTRLFLPNFYNAEQNGHFSWTVTTTNENEQLGTNRVICHSNYDFRDTNLHHYSETATNEKTFPVMRSLTKGENGVVQTEIWHTDEIKRKHNSYWNRDDISKIIIQRYGDFHVFPDWENEYLLGTSVFAITFPKEAPEQMERALEWLRRDNIKKMFTTDLMWSTADPNICWKLFQIMRKNFYEIH